MIEPVRKIPMQPWMKTPETRKLMLCLNQNDEQPQSLFVGGCVRNSIMGTDFGEIDIATRYTSKKVTEILGGEGFNVIPTGIDHGTVTAVLYGKHFEITTLRRDVRTDGRHAQVTFTDDWTEDAARRDFTMNTLLADMQGHIYDPLGTGLPDLDARRVIFVGNAAERIKEDYLRILRFFRFYALYGEGDADEQALAACRDFAHELKNLSRERITQEFLKILGAERAADVLALMFANGVLAGLPHKNFRPEMFGIVHDTLARLVVLADGDAGHMNVLENYLVLSNKQKTQYANVIAAINDIDLGAKKQAYLYGITAAEQAQCIVAASMGEKPDLSDLQDWQVPVLPVGGDDVMAAGVPAGPALGKVLKEVEQWWIENDFMPDRSACLDKISLLFD